MYETPTYAATAFLLPPTALLLLALAALIWLRDHPRTRALIVVASLGGLLALSLPVVAFALMRALEPAPLDEAVLKKAQAIVILGGGRNRTAPEWGGVTVNAITLQRLRYGAKLARISALPVLVAGGAPDGSGAAEADLMRAILQDEFGVRVRWIDDESMTTRENARFSAQLLLPAQRRVVLVTDGWHSARARAEFEQNGFEVIPAPTGLVGSRPFSLYQLVPNVESLRYTHIALREWFSAIWYRLTT
ncbi:MAG TPA: YdcF family protein [Burkholderiaceae bacterium]|nr:YdcF family protein [Burkholderiaceae bacterium]